MNNDELKRKIAEIILQGVHAEPLDNSMAIEIADALISAGIGDLSELKKHRILVKPVSIPNDENFYIVPQTEIDIKQLYNGEEVEQIVKERDKYKHRAEVAERAFDIAADLVMSQEIDEEDYEDIIYEWNGKRGKSNYSFTIDDLKEYILEQAEKELEEERKDE